MDQSTQISRIMNTLLVVGLIVFSTNVPIAYLQEDTAFWLFISRGQGSNVIEFFCRESATLIDISSASYFMNGTRINGHSQFSLFNNGRLTFKITRDLEATYSCGNESNRPLSNNRSLIAYPDSELVLKQPPRYVVKGERVQIDCGVLPGKLLQQYTIDWYKSTQMIVARNIPMGSPDGHYAVDPSTLSLIINNVTEADTNARYRCELSVRDPETQQTDNYNNVLGRNFITLIVLGIFRLQVDVTQEGDVFFEITVPERLIEPVGLQINYTDIGNPTNRISIINTTSAYLGNISFLHREYRSQVPFEEFRVGVRLLSHSKLTETIGPLVQDPADYAKSRSTICNVTTQNLGSIVGGGVGGGMVFILFLLGMFICVFLFSWACYKVVKKNKQLEDQRKHEIELKQKDIDLKVMVLNKPNDIVNEFRRQICDTRNPVEVRVAMINVIPELIHGITPRSAADITANGASAIPITTQAEPINASPQPEMSALIVSRGAATKGSDVAVEIEKGQRIQKDGGDALAGPPSPPQSMVIIKEQESPEVLEALQALISGFSKAHNGEENDVGHT